MLTLTALKNNSTDGKSSGIPAYLKATEYYLGKDGNERSTSQWLGRGAEALGLRGEVKEKVMDLLAQGFGPKGEALRQNAGAKPEMHPVLDREGKPRIGDDGKPMMTVKGERIGFDLTFSAPKSVAVVFAGSDPALRDRLLNAHRDAVASCLRFVEEHVAETRRGKAGKEVVAARLVISSHTHFGAREHEKDWKERGGARMDVDPQLHTHNLVYNVCQAADGSWATLEAAEIYRYKKTVGAMYRAELAANLRGIGFGIEPDIRLDANGQVKERFFKIAGIPDGLSEQMSGRRKQILDYMREHEGVSAQEANLRTRKSKDEPTFTELLDRWHADLADYRQANPGLLPERMADLLEPAAVRRAQKQAPGLDREAQEAHDREVLEELHATKSVWTKADLIEQIASREGEGRLGLTAVLKEADAFLARNDLAVVRPERLHKEDRGESGQVSRRYREVRYADHALAVKVEQDLLRAAVERKDERAVRLDPEVVEAAIADMKKSKGIALSDEQRKAVQWATEGTGGVAVIQGRAGTGKTTMALALVDAFHRGGRETIGCATGWDAAKKLEAEAGITSYSIASLTSKLASGKLRLTDKTVILVDEAGMVGTPSLQKLMAFAHAAKAKVILQGDALQLQSVERGGPLRLLAQSLGSVNLTEIRRQKGADDRAMAQAFYAAGGTELRSRRENAASGQKILLTMEKRGQLQGFNDREQAMQVLVQDYIKSKVPARDKLVIAGTRADVAALNEALRSHRRAAGELGADTRIQTTTGRRDVLSKMTVAEGDRIRFGKKDEGLGVVNGTKGIVVGLTAEPGGHHQVEVQIESDIPGQDGRRLTFSTAQYGSLDLGYAGTVHKAQGAGALEVFHLGHRGMQDRHLALVSFTRMKSSYTCYGASSDLFDRSIDAATVSDRFQMNVLQEGLATPKTTRQLALEDAKAAPVLASRKGDPVPVSKLDPLVQRAVEAWQRLTAAIQGRRIAQRGPGMSR
jgi:conjugative relaxase-like TrwC/TraI family protein